MKANAVKKVVAMPLIPSTTERGTALRADLEYAEYSKTTWEWWCKRNGIEFAPLEERPARSNEFMGMPPSFTRWLAPESLFERYGNDLRLAVVDADTMIRWDAPDFFELAGTGFAAALDINPSWIIRDIKAYQALFPGIDLMWWQYFNAGVVVMGYAQLDLLRRFLAFAACHWRVFLEIQASGCFSTDQTALNFFLKREGEEVCILPPPFNSIGCFPMDANLQTMEASPTIDWMSFASHAFSRPRAFDFIEYGYIWHFTSVIRYRRVVMGETWRRVRHNYR